MSGISNIPSDATERIQDLKYLYASIVNVSNFVSVKLSSDRNFHLWKTQMLCLMRSHKMGGIVDDTLVKPGALSMEMMDQYDCLLKGWIFGSVTENVLGAVVDLTSAKDVWDRLKSFYDVPVSRQQASTLSVEETEAEAERQTDDTDVNLAQTNTNGEDAVVITVVSTKTETENEAAKKEAAWKNNVARRLNLSKATMKGDWSAAESILKEDKDLVTKAISCDGSTVLHIAIGIGHNDFVKNLFSYISDEDVIATRNSDGSTALHIAAIVGNTYAAELLIKKNKHCLRIKDKKGEEPLHKAYENMRLDTIEYLWKADDEYCKSMSRSFSIGVSVHSHLNPGVEIGVGLLVNAISAKRYNLASELIKKFPKFASKNDDVLMAIARNFPSEDYGVTYLLISWKHLCGSICNAAKGSMSLGVSRGLLTGKWIGLKDKIVFMVPALLLDVFFILCGLILLPILVLLYVIIWIGILLVEPITHIQKKTKETYEADKVLKLVCDQIDKLDFTGTHHPYYTRPILMAACQNAHKVVDEILYRSPHAISSRDKKGYDIIQLAVIHRSERIYNLIFETVERVNIYRSCVDDLNNNMLHLAGRLPALINLNKRAGAALQLQRELQWFEELKKVVFPTYITQENKFEETPGMVFTREHEKLMKDGESWMKTTAESSSITAALITTIVFAAAITVPGGSNQDTGMPVFTKDIAFIIFCVSDAISLFASSTALLVFLSILTARFTERDFLVSLPRRLLIGICSLLLSAISMMVAFSSTLFLVFCHQKLWMLAPICGLSLIPISFFVALQLPLVVDLFQSTYGRKFGPRRRGN